MLKYLFVFLPNQLLLREIDREISHTETRHRLPAAYTHKYTEKIQTHKVSKMASILCFLGSCSFILLFLSFLTLVSESGTLSALVSTEGLD